MEQHSSTYQSFKILLGEYLPIDRDILHVVIGLVLTLAAILMTRKSLRLRPFFGAFVIACLIGGGMEMLDRIDDLQTLGDWRWRASAADFGRTIFIPLIGLLIALFLHIKRRQ